MMQRLLPFLSLIVLFVALLRGLLSVRTVSD